MRLRSFWALCVAFCLVVGCGDDAGPEPTQDSGQPQPDSGRPQPDSGRPNTLPDSGGPDSSQPSATGRVIGVITDVRGNRLDDVEVTLAGRTARTDGNGQFSLGDVQAGEQLALVATLEGFSSGRVRVDVLEDRDQLVKVVMQRAEMATLSDPSVGGMVQTPSGVTLELPANAIVDAEGNPVTGPVEMAIALLNDRDEIMAAPGGLLAVDPDNAADGVTPLESFGMVEVTLTANGEEVNIAEGVDVDLVFPLAPNHGFDDGDSIGLWHFDETDEAWKLIGEGIVEGDSFRAVVSHFSWWNADQIMTKTCVVGRVLDASGAPIAGAQMVADGRSYLGTTQSMSAGDGSYCIEARISSVIELSSLATVSGQTQALAVQVSTPRTMGSCNERDTCFEIQDLVAVGADTQALCEPSACPQEAGKEACCMTDLGPCDFVVNGDCGGNEDGSWDAPPDQPGVMPIDGVPMPLPPGGDAGVPMGGAGGEGGASGEGGEGGESGQGGEGGQGGQGGSGQPDASVEPDASVDPDDDAGTSQGGQGGIGGGDPGGNGGVGGTPGGNGGVGGGGVGGGGVGGGGVGGMGGVAVDRCDDAIPLDSLAPVSGSTFDSSLRNDWWDQGSCNSYLPGYERVYAVMVPGYETLRARAIGPNARTVIASDCADVNGSCASATSTAYFHNDTPEERTVYVIVDNTQLDAQVSYTLYLTTGPDACGDGLREYSESCDDGNFDNGDGCDATCEVEPGYFCADDGMCSPVICGDGVRQNPTGEYPGPSEECDDGEPAANGDGCDVYCQREPGFVCEEDGMPCRQIVCGDGIVDGNGGGSQGGECNPSETYDEQCDDNDAEAGDGCDASCKVEAGFTCSGEPSACGARPSGDLCSNPFALAPGVYDLTGYGNDFSQTDGPDNAFVVTVPDDHIVRVAGAAQFDGHVSIVDAANCRYGWSYGQPLYAGQPFSHAFAGDMYGDPEEDEGEQQVLVVFSAYSGEPNLELTLSAASVTAPICGDGVISEALEESCDDGGAEPGDGCDDLCQVEAGYACEGGGGCRLITCNDGYIDWPQEECEDLNTANGDGCSSDCRIEVGQLCDLDAEPMACESRPSGDLCNNAQILPAGFYQGSFDLEGMSSDYLDCPQCDVTRWLSVTVQPGEALSAVVLRSTFSGQIAVYDHCPHPWFGGGSGMGEGFSPQSPASLYLVNEEAGPATWFVSIGAGDGGMGAEALEVDIAFKTGAPGCGDGMRSYGSESCDDMNTSDGDGCSSDCQLEGGSFECPEQGGPCLAAVCGDGKLFQGDGAAYEECDDSGTAPADGCDADCRVENGWACSGEPSACHAAAPGEVCSSAQALATGMSTHMLHGGYEPGCMEPEGCEPEAWLSFTLAPRERFEAQITASFWGQAELIAMGAQGCREYGNGSGPTFGPEPGILYAQNDGNAPILYMVRLRSYDNEAGMVDFDVVKGIEQPELCGNGELDGNEHCDDSGNAPGDGCDASCVREVGFACTGVPSVCQMLAAGDLCENAEALATGSYSLAGYTSDAGPGGWYGPTRWFTGGMQPGEAVNLTVTTSDLSSGYVRIYDLSHGGCSVLSGAAMELPLDPSTPVVIAHVNTRRFPIAFGVQVMSNDPSPSSASVSMSYAIVAAGCGDGFVDRDGEGGAPEACDDGGTAPGDGCDASCKLEAGYGCVGNPSTCSVRAQGDLCSNPLALTTTSYDLEGFTRDYDYGPEQGSDIVLSVELPPGDMLRLVGTSDFYGSIRLVGAAQCGIEDGGHDHNLEGGAPFDIAIDRDQAGISDGAGSSLRLIVVAYDFGSGSNISFSTVSVSTPYCGDGAVRWQDNEQCDDGNGDSGDGCSSSCRTEPGYTCPYEGGECHTIVCGDGIVDSEGGRCGEAEQCDDGGTDAGDGCDSSCRIEPGFSCYGQPSVCALPLEGDVCQTAEPIANAAYSLDGFFPDDACETICGGPDRWLTVDVPMGQQLVVDATTNSSQSRLHLIDVTSGCEGPELMPVAFDSFDSMSPGHVQWANFGGGARTIALVLEAATPEPTSITVSYVLEPAEGGGGMGCPPGDVLTCDEQMCMPEYMLGDANCDAFFDCPQLGYDGGDCGGGAGGTGGTGGAPGGFGGAPMGGTGGVAGDEEP